MADEDRVEGTPPEEEGPKAEEQTQEIGVSGVQGRRSRRAAASAQPASGQPATANKKEEPVSTEQLEYEPPPLREDEDDDSTKRTWSKYGNLEAASVGARIADAERNKRVQAETQAPFYVFRGHRDRHNATTHLNTRVGRVKVDGKIKLPDDELARLRRMGFRFDRAR